MSSALGGDALPPALLAEVLLRAPVGIAILDHAHRFLLVNDVLARINGVPADQHVGRTLGQVVPQTAPSTLAQLRRVWEKGLPMLHVVVETPTRRQPDTVRSFRCSWVPVRQKGRILAVIAYVEELTAEHRAQIAVDAVVRDAGLAAEVGAALADADLDVRGTAGRVAARVAAAVGEVCMVCLLTSGATTLEPVAIEATRPEMAAAIRRYVIAHPPSTDVSIHAEVVAQGEMVYATRPGHEMRERFNPSYRQYLDRFRLQSFIVAPLRARGRVLGTLAVCRRPPVPGYSERERQWVQDLADRAGLALANALLFADQRSTSQELHRLLQLTDVMLGRESLPDLLEGLLPALQKVLPADVVRLLIIDPDRPRLRPLGAVGVHVDVADVAPSIGEGIAGGIAATHSPVIVDDARSSEPNRPMLPGGGVRSLAGVPVLAGSDLVGVLEVGSYQLRRFGAEDLRLLERAADRICAAVNALRLAGQLHTVQRQAQAVLDTAGDAIITIDDASRIRMVNRAGCELFRYHEDELVGRNVSVLMPEPHRSKHNDYVAHFLRTGERRILGRARELDAQRSDGTQFPIELHVTEVSNGSSDRLFTAVLRDITDRRRAEAQLRQQALHDPLTGLANRTLFRDRLNHALARQQRQHTKVAVLFLDLDRFKVVNDSLGHPAGDRMLEQVAGRLFNAMRPTDTVARFGGDEFVVLVDHVNTADAAHRVAERLLAALSQPFQVQAEELGTTASIGIAYSHPEQSADELLRDADAALYRAKEAGGDRYEIFDEPLRRSVHRRLLMENELRHAVAHDEIEVYYQPEQSLTDGRIDCVEALARWRHPDRGLLAAAEFIAVAEETGLIVALGNRVLERTATQQQSWSQCGPDIAINLSPQQLIRPGLLDELTAAGLDPGKLWVEVTETTLITNLSPIAARLKELRELGVRVAIDDFGTGYSSLTHLRRLPIDAMKIDKTFVERLGIDPDDTAIVTAVINLGQQMGIRVIAEGVETERQLNLLTDLGCHYAQGHLIAAAGAADDIYPLLDQPQPADQHPVTPRDRPTGRFG